MKKTILVLRAVSGVGKSSFAEFIKSLYNDAVIICADDHFIKSGEYQFDPTQLWHAHRNCYKKFEEAIDNNKEVIIVANTNTSPKEFKFYEDYGKKHGYQVFFTVLEKRHDGVNQHQVPEQTLMKQEQRLLSSLKLR